MRLSPSPAAQFQATKTRAVLAAAMAASLIRGRPRNESERFFQDSTRTVVEAILHVARDNPDPDNLLSLVSLPREQLHAALRGTPAYALIDPEAHDQGAGILGTATNAIKTFVHLPKRNQSERSWNAGQWARERRGWIFLPAREDLNEASEQFCQMDGAYLLSVDDQDELPPGLCPACDNLSPWVDITGENIVHCYLCHDRHQVTPEQLAAWEQKLRARYDKQPTE